MADADDMSAVKIEMGVLWSRRLLGRDRGRSMDQGDDRGWLFGHKRTARSALWANASCRTPEMRITLKSTEYGTSSRS